MIQINPLKSYIDGGVRAALTTPPSASLVFDLPGKAIWVKGVKLKGTDHTYIFNHDNYITLTNTPDKNNPESEDIKIGVNITTLKNVIDTTYNGGTLALLQEGLNTEERTWLAKILHNYINNVLPVTKNLKINGTNYAIYTTENSLPLFFVPVSLGTTGQILACTSSGLIWVDLIQNTDYRVSLSSATSNSDYRIILKQGANNNPETDFVRFSEYLTFNPYTKTLKINNIKVVTATDIYTGSTVGLVPAATSAQLNYYLRGDGTWVNIATEMAAANTWRPIKVGNTDALGSGSNTGTLSFIAGTGIALSWDATNKRIIITNSSPDVNHNTDENVRQVPKTDNVNRPLMMINGSTSAGEQINTSMFSTGIYANASTKMITANGFIKAGSSDNYVLLGEGGHKLESNLSVYSAILSDKNKTIDITASEFKKAQYSGFYKVTDSTSDAPLPDGYSGGHVAIHAAWDNGTNTAGLDLLINDSISSYLYFRARVGGGGIGDWRTIIDSANYTAFCAASDHNHDGKYLRKDTNDSTPYQYTFTKTNDHAIRVGTVRGTAVGSQTGEYIHLYERVAIGSPSGWGSRPAPSYGLATYGGAWLATDTGQVGIGTTYTEAKLDINGTTNIYLRGLDNTPFKTLLNLKALNSTELYGDDWNINQPSHGITFTRYWTSGSSPYGETKCAGIYGTVSASWRGGLVFRTKNNEISGGSPDITALLLKPSGGIWTPKHIAIGANLPTYDINRAEFDLVSAGNYPNDLWFGTNSSRNWGFSSRTEAENYYFMLYNPNHGAVIYADNNTANIGIGTSSVPRKLCINGDAQILKGLHGIDNTPEHALLHTGTGRGDNEAGSTWIFIDDCGNYTNNIWGIKANQPDNYIEYYGAGERRGFVNLNSGGGFLGNHIISEGRSYIQSDWLQINDSSGIYWPNANNASYFFPNIYTDFGNFVILGSRGGYSGFLFGNSTNYMTIMDSGTHKGIYSLGWGDWILYFNLDSKRLGLRTSSLTGYAVTCEGDFYCRSGWLRTEGATGWYNESYGGGWYMTDTSWMRSYNGKGIVAGGFYHSSYGSSEYVLTTDGGARHLSNLLDRRAIGIQLSSAGWKRVLIGDGEDNRGSVRFSILTTGGNWVPYYTQVKALLGWEITEFTVEGLMPYVSSFRFTRESGHLYIECYFTQAIYFEVYKIQGYHYVDDNGGWTLVSGEVNGSGTIIGGEHSYNGVSLYTSGTFRANGNSYASHFYENSDIRYKKILNNLLINSNTIANLPLFDFEWIENNTIGTGTSAQAVQEILPNLVSGTDKLTLDYGVLGTIAGITACKELVTLKSELQELKEKVKLLEDKLRKYENTL